MTKHPSLQTQEQRAAHIPTYSTRGRPVAPPAAGAFDLPLVGCCINADWMAHILGSTAVLEWADMWDGTPEEKQFALDQVLRIQDAMTCRCGGTSTSIIRNTITNNYRFQLGVEFELNGLAGVAPDAPNTFFDEDSGDDWGEAERRKLALCWAVTDYVITIYEGIVNTAIDIGLEVAGFAVPLAFTVGPVAGVSAVVAIAGITNDIILLLRNDETRDDIICCMLDALGGLAITEENFNQSLSGCGFTVPSIKDTLRELVEESLNDSGNFLSFVKSLGAYMAVTDLLSTCLCDETFETCDFTIDECGWQPVPGGPGLQATYDAGLGWDNGPGGSVNHYIKIKRVLSVDTTVSKIRIFTVNTLGASDIRYGFSLFDIDDIQIGGDEHFGPSSETSHTFTFAENPDVRTIEILIMKMGAQTDFPGHLTAVQVVAEPEPFPEQ